jgi:ABC-type transport system involved in cytochrome c biogenesis permease subunit
MTSKRRNDDVGIKRFLPYILVGCFASSIINSLRPPSREGDFDLNGFGRLPVLNGGRLKPMDTVARISLLVLSGKQTVHLDHRTLDALSWLIDVMFQPEKADAYPVFEIDNPDVLGFMGIQQTQKRRFSFAEIEPHADAIENQASQAEQIKSEQRSRYQTAILDLQNQVVLYQKLQNTLQVAGSENRVQALQDFEQRLDPALKAHLKSPQGTSELIGSIMKDLERYRFLDHVAEFFPLPLPGASSNHGRWTTIGAGMLLRLESNVYHPSVVAYATMSDAWRMGDPIIFNQALHDYQGWLARHVPRDLSMCGSEFIFNYVEPFYQSMIIYLAVFILSFLSWLVWPKTLNKSAFYLLLLAFTVHTTGLLSRMWLQGRPPVTNLYSSAIFVGWVSVLLGIVLERLYRNGIGSMVAAAIGFITLIIAHHLASSGDTLEMMRAVLDSNFWLATHVVCITIGYGSTFLSGFLATLYIFRRLFDLGWNRNAAVTLERMVYGVVCFSMFFSFLGTILGGIWADQSWGRFWGWDPKENGALMIVLWNAFILHARLGGYAKGKNLMVLAVFGNIVTAMSWFGVNMLGIGLHSYGFMEQAFVWLIFFVVSQILVMSLAFFEPRKIRSASTKISSLS